MDEVLQEADVGQDGQIKYLDALRSHAYWLTTDFMYWDPETRSFA